MLVHRVHGCEEHALSLFSEPFSSRNQSTVGNRVHVCHVPDVVDVLGEVLCNQYICLAAWDRRRSLLSVPESL